MVNYSKEQQHALDMIEHYEEKLSQADNNLRYIKALKALRHWLETFSHILSDEERQASAEYEALFYTSAGWALYDKICMSITEYNYGVRPF